MKLQGETLVRPVSLARNKNKLHVSHLHVRAWGRGGEGDGGGGVFLSSYSKMQHFTSLADNLCAAITKSNLLVWGLLSQAAFPEITTEGEATASSIISIRRRLHTALFRPAMLDQYVPWTVSMLEQRSLPSLVHLTSFSKIPIRFFGWEVVAREPGEC